MNLTVARRITIIIIFFFYILLILFRKNLASAILREKICSTATSLGTKKTVIKPITVKPLMNRSPS